METKGKKYWLFYFTLALIFSTGYLFYLDFSNFKQEGKLVFRMLDVGQGDALLIQSPSGKNILIDAGSDARILPMLSEYLSPFEKNIDLIFITNPDRDHIGGFESVLKKYKVGGVFEPGTFNSSQTYKELQDEIARQKVPHFLARQGTKIEIGDGAYIEILFPDRDVIDFSTNDGSVVARLVYGVNSIMLTGDATTVTEQFVIHSNSGEKLKSDILKVGHHGSRSSTSNAFLKLVQPQYAIISVGKDNSYGHPHQITLDTLQYYGIQILRTDEVGTITFTCDKIEACQLN